MLGKVFKHDFKNTGRMLWIVQAAALLAAIVIAICVSVLVNYDPISSSSNMANTMTFSLLIQVIMLMALALAASYVITLVGIFARYYKSFHTDEGYLTFTLPISPTTHLWSKVISGMLWMAINFTILTLGAVLIVYTVGSKFGYYFGEFYSDIVKLASEFGVSQIQAILAAITNGLFIIMTAYFSITLGSMIVRRYKLLIGALLYIGVSWAASIIEAAVSASIAFSSSETLSSVSMVTNTSSWFSIIFSLVLSAVFFILTRMWLNKNLNLQ